MALPATAYPGLLLGPVSIYLPGGGTHVFAGQIYASLAGTVSSESTSRLPTLSVARARSTEAAGPPVIPSHNVTASNRLPAVGDTVLGRVVRVQARQAALAILVVEDSVCADAFAGVVRREDVRGWELDRVVMADSFRVGDIVRAVVISLGDQTSYYLSTARNELGVLMARSEQGSVMLPISWQAFQDPTTGRTESRKVAKPV